MRASYFGVLELGPEAALWACGAVQLQLLVQPAVPNGLDPAHNNANNERAEPGP